MNIRLMTADDYERVFELWINTPGMGLNNLDDSREGIEKFLARNPGTCFVAEAEGALAGVIMSGHDTRRGYIYHMAVERGGQRQGTGEALLNAALAALKSEGITRVSLLVFRDNEKGNAFWEKQGFKVREDVLHRSKDLIETVRINTLN